MGLFTNKIGPVFLKETNDADLYIEKLKGLLLKSDDTSKKKIETKIKLAECGKSGENSIKEELRHAGMDMFVLHDICLESKGNTTQIDFIIITRKRIYVIECKNLIGDIEIDNSGNFIRTYQLEEKEITEDMHSPIAQNLYHMQIIKELWISSKGNILSKLLSGKNFDTNYQSLVVLANSNTRLNSRYAKKEIKEQIIRIDQLTQYLREKDAQIKENSMSENKMRKIAQFFLEQNKSERFDYSKKYNLTTGHDKLLGESVRLQILEKKTGKIKDVYSIKNKGAKNKIHVQFEEKGTEYSYNSQNIEIIYKSVTSPPHISHRIYKFERQCYKCHQNTLIYTYIVFSDNPDDDVVFPWDKERLLRTKLESNPDVGVSDIDEFEDTPPDCNDYYHKSYELKIIGEDKDLDKLMTEKFPEKIKILEDKSKQKYAMNICKHCGARQGRFHINCLVNKMIYAKKEIEFLDEELTT